MKTDICKYYEDDINLIIDGLYLGNSNIRNNESSLRNNNIKYIICVRNELGPLLKDIKYFHIPIKDNMINTIDIFQLFDDTIKYISNNIKNGNILIHCKRGHHRSATIIVAYIFSILNINITSKNFNKIFENIVEHVNNIRNCALRRDTNMMKKLYEYLLNKYNINYNIYFLNKNHNKRYIKYKLL